MLHELLLALQGYHGTVFYLQQQQQDEQEGGVKFKVNGSLPLFHPAELSVLRSLLSVATEYLKISEFIRTHRDADNQQKSSNGDGGLLQGLYVEALCEGLLQVLLPYRQTLVDLERDILSNGHVQMSHIQHRIMPFQPLLSSLNCLIRQLRLREAHGCYILDVIYKASCSGVAKVQDAMKILLFEGHKVMYKQLLAWILQGSLFDPFDEFFISASSRDGADKTDASQLTFAAEHSTVSNAPQLSSNVRLKYHLNAAMVPGHISLQLAEKIFFIGESIQLFEADRKLEEQGSVLRERETEFYQQLAQLRDEPEFRAADFERFVDSIRESASRHLHSLVLERSDLKEELLTARNFFLLGRGELFHTFVHLADTYLQRPVAATTQHDVSQCFQSACRSILPDDEVISKKIKILVQQPSAEDAKAVGWKCLSLQYLVPWPLHLILSETSLEAYNRVFQFLITVKRTQLALHKVWADQMAKKRESCSHPSELRTHMIFVVDNLQQYFMADVLESQFAIMMKKLDQSTDFEDLRHAHDIFLNSVTTLTFINNKPVNQCLSELLSACLQYCRALDYPDNDARERSISNFGLAFGRQSGFLFQLLSSLRNHHTGSHLAQLLLRVDFNRYFSKHGHDVGKIA